MYKCNSGLGANPNRFCFDLSIFSTEKQSYKSRYCAYTRPVPSSGTYTLRFNGNINNINANFSAATLGEKFKTYFKEYSSKERAFLHFLKNEISAAGVELFKIMNNGTIKRKFLKDNGRVDSEN